MALSKGCTVSYRSNTEVVVSNFTRDTHVWIPYAFELSCVDSDLATGLSLPRNPAKCLRPLSELHLFLVLYKNKNKNKTQKKKKNKKL